MKWVGGRDDGLLSVIDQSWIKNFDESEWQEKSPAARETEIAEWRVGKVPESGHYRSFDCRVIDCSGKLTCLLIRFSFHLFYQNYSAMMLHTGFNSAHEVSSSNIFF